MKPNTGQPCEPVWVVIFGHELGSFPYPVQFVEPTAYCFRRHLDAMFGLERRGEGRTTPPRAAPAIGPWGFFEYGTQRACEPGHEDGRLHRDGELPIWIDTYAQAPGAICSHDAVHAGARTKQVGRNVCRISTRRTQQ